MFTGIVTAVGRVRHRVAGERGLELTIACPYEGLVPGESVAVDGACLTAQSVAPGEFTSHIIRTSLERTNFSTYEVGRTLNLERALQVGDRLGGHLVQGHVDGVGAVERVAQRQDARLLDIRVRALFCACFDDVLLARRRRPRCQSSPRRQATRVSRPLFPDDDLRVFAPVSPRFECGCSRQRVEGALRVAGRVEIEEALAADGQVEVVCEFCARRYLFSPDQARALFVADGAGAATAPTRH